MKVIEMKLSEIKPYENNPRFNESAIKEIAKSIQEFGFQNPIVVDKNNTIINGHTRYGAAKQLGLKIAPVIVRDDLSEDEVRALRIADNKTSEFATWNYETLISEINDLQDNEYDINQLGFSSDILNDLLYHEEEHYLIDGETHPDYLPEQTDTPAVSEFGSIYELGEHRLLCAKKFDNTLMPSLMCDGDAKLYLAKINEWSNDVGIVLRYGSNNLSAGGIFYAMSQNKDILNVRLACQGCDLEVHEGLLWLKSNFKMGEFGYQIQNENILYGWKPGASHKWYSDRKQTNILQFNNTSAGLDPVAMSIYLIMNSTSRRDVVLDNFSTTGNSIIACEQTGRRCRMVVNDEKVADLVRQRWAEFVNGVGCDWATLTKKINKKAVK